MSYLTGLHVPHTAVPSDEERTVGINGRISNLLVAKIFTIPIAHADLLSLLHFETKAFLHYLLHWISFEILIVLSYRNKPQIQRIATHIQTVIRMLQLPAVRMVPESDEEVRAMVQEHAEYIRHGVSVSELEDEAAVTDAELQRIRRRIWATGSPLDSETDNKALQVNFAATEVENGVEPTAHDRGVGCDSDGDIVSVNLDGVDVGPGSVRAVDDSSHSL